MSSKRPGLKWYPGDLRRDVALQSCSIAARGLWYELLWVMHDGEPYGHLSVEGNRLSEQQVATLVGVTPSVFRKLSAELLAAGVPSQREDGCWFSRRMVRDEEIRLARANGGKAGGNPALTASRKVNHREPIKVNLSGGGEVNAISRAGPPPQPSGAVGSALEGVRGNQDQPGSSTARLASRILSQPSRWMVEQFLSDLPDRESPDAWAGVMLSALDGIGLPGGVPVSVSELAAACAEYPTVVKDGRWGARHFLACVERTRRGIARGDKPAPKGGVETFARMRERQSREAGDEWLAAQLSQGEPDAAA